MRCFVFTQCKRMQANARKRTSPSTSYRKGKKVTLVLKYKHKRKDHRFSFSSCLRLCLRSLALSKNGRNASTTSRFYSQRRVVREKMELVNFMSLCRVLVFALWFVFTCHESLVLALTLAIVLASLVKTRLYSAPRLFCILLHLYHETATF